MTANLRYGALALTMLIAACNNESEPDLTVGLMHLASVQYPCPETHQPVEPADEHCSRYDPIPECGVHADCTGDGNGRCVVDVVETGGCYCAYDECLVDSDCEGADEHCLCGGLPGVWYGSNHTCRWGNCRSDLDCASGLCLGNRVSRCGVGIERDSTAPVEGFFCASSRDRCRGDKPCAGDKRCLYSIQAGIWDCVNDPGLGCIE